VSSRNWGVFTPPRGGGCKNITEPTGGDHQAYTYRLDTIISLFCEGVYNMIYHRITVFTYPIQHYVILARLG